MLLMVVGDCCGWERMIMGGETKGEKRCRCWRFAFASMLIQMQSDVALHMCKCWCKCWVILSLLYIYIGTHVDVEQRFRRFALWMRQSDGKRWGNGREWCRCRRFASTLVLTQMQSDVALHLCQCRCKCWVTLSSLCICISVDIVVERRRYKCRVSTSACPLPSLPFYHLSLLLSFTHDNHTWPLVMSLFVITENVTQILKLPFYLLFSYFCQ